jgi:hypothetical protein
MSSRAPATMNSFMANALLGDGWLVGLAANYQAVCRKASSSAALLVMTLFMMFLGYRARSAQVE